MENLQSLVVGKDTAGILRINSDDVLARNQG